MGDDSFLLFWVYQDCVYFWNWLIHKEPEHTTTHPYKIEQEGDD